jgi:hypothetical protein
MDGSLEGVDQALQVFSTLHDLAPSNSLALILLNVLLEEHLQEVAEIAPISVGELLQRLLHAPRHDEAELGRLV